MAKTIGKKAQDALTTSNQTFKSPTYTAPKYQEVSPYDSKYGKQIDALIQSAVNREPFTYDPNTDPAYRSYAKEYGRLGNLARQDTLGDYAANTGGYASTAAVSAAQQAQNDYNQRLSMLVPELMNAAYNRYQGDFNMDMQTLGALTDRDDSMYGRWQDNRDYLRSVFENDRGFGYNVFNDNRNFDYGIFQDQRAYNQWLQEFNEQRNQWLQEFVLNQDKWNYQKEEDKNNGSSGGKGGGTSKGRRGKTTSSKTTTKKKTTTTTKKKTTKKKTDQSSSDWPLFANSVGNVYTSTMGVGQRVADIGTDQINSKKKKK